MPNLVSSASFVHNPYMLELPAVAELAKLRQWVCWKMELSPKGKPTKVPYQINGYKASSTNRKHWADHTDVFKAAYVEGKFDGIGFVFTADDPYVGVDLDKCQADGGLTPFASEAIQNLSSYAETSPSGTGLHIICRGSLPAAIKTDGIEMYDRGRFFCFTGQQLEGAPETIEPAGEALRELFEAHSSKSDGNGHAPEAVASLELGFELTTEANPDSLKLMALIENDSKFKKSWQHKRQDLKDTSNSAYDLSLCSVAAMAGWPDAEIYALMVAHRKQYGGVEKCLREDYVRTTLAKVRTMRPDIELVEQAALQAKGDDLGAFGAISERLGVNVEALIQYGKADAVYYLHAAGEEIRIGTVGDLLSQRVVEHRLAESQGIVLPTMKAYQWKQIVEMMLPLITHKEADEESRIVSVCGFIDLYVNETEPGKWRQKDDYESRAPFVKDGFLHIRMLRLLEWADRRCARYSEAEFSRGLKMLEFERHSTSYRDGGRPKNLKFWRRILPKGGVMYESKRT